MPNPALVPNRPEYYVQTGSMFENPYGVPHDEIVSMMLELPSEMAAQVIFGKYVESSGLVFSGETIQMMIDREAEHYAQAWTAEDRITGDRWIDTETREQIRTWKPWPKRQRFHTGIDFARQTDYTVISTIDTLLRPARLVYWRRLNRVPWETIYLEVGRAVHMWGESSIGDSTGMAGDVIFDALESRRYCPVHDRTVLVESGICRDRHGNGLKDCETAKHVPLSCVDEYDFTTNSKKQLVEHLRNAMQTGYRSGSDDPFGWIRTPAIVQLEEELSFYAWDDKGLQTDAVMSLALAVWQGLEDVPAPPLVGAVHGG